MVLMWGQITEIKKQQNEGNKQRTNMQKQTGSQRTNTNRQTDKQTNKQMPHPFLSQNQHLDRQTQTALEFPESYRRESKYNSVYC